MTGDVIDDLLGRRTDREPAATAESRVNGCPDCASVHAPRFAWMKGDKAPAQPLLDGGVDTPMPPRRRAIVDHAVKLGATPSAAMTEDIGKLRAEGLDNADIRDTALSIAMFAHANRLMQTFGEAVCP